MSVIWKGKVRDPSDFHVARRGDHLMTPFECDLCIFRKLKKRDPLEGHAQDNLLLGVIRRMNLDAFWSRASSTVIGNARRAEMMVELAGLMGLEGPFEELQEYDLEDHCGYQVAATTLLQSRRPGRHDSLYTQFQTIRKQRTTFGNQVRAASQSNASSLVLLDEKGGYRRLVKDKCGSLWFNRFVAGMANRMGQIWRPNKALSVDQMVELARMADARVLGATDDDEKNQWSSFLTYAVVSYVLSLRGNEGFMMDIDSMWKHRDRNDGTYFTVGLMGRVKGENHDRCHLIPCVNETGSGIRVRNIVLRHMDFKRSLGQRVGPLISDLNGFLFEDKRIDDCLTELLEEMFELDSTGFPAEIDEKEKLPEFYQCFRTFRRTSDTRALDVGVDGNDIDIVNRWEKKEKAGTRKPGMEMKQHYADFQLLIQPFKRYGSKM